MKVVFLTSLILLVSGFVQAQNTGSICAAKFEKPKTGEKSLGNPTGGDSYHAYKIRVGEQTIIGSYEKNVVIGGLSLKKKHSVKIYRDGELIQSFRFSFNDFESPKLCLFLKELYDTWQLWEAKKSVSCSCK